MKLQFLHIEQVRQFRQPLRIEHFAPGINIFSGPNESGKSTLVRAIRAAFLERHRSGAVEDLQPWGDSAAAPSIAIGFEWQGKRWDLHKSFLKHKRCDLSVDGQRFTGEQAEEKLATLLGFQHPQRGASKAEHWGIPGLLWIEQGQGHTLHDAVGYAASQIQCALGGSLGEIASSAGDEILARVQSQRALFLTKNTGKPSGEYHRAIQECEALEQEMQALDAKIAQYRQQVDRLGQLRQQQMQADKGQAWRQYRESAEAARRQLAQIQALRVQLVHQRSEHGSLLAQLDLLREQLEHHHRLEQSLRERHAHHAAAAQRFAQLQTQQTTLEQQKQLAQTAYDDARQNLQHARLQAQRQAMLHTQAQRKADMQERQERIDKARGIEIQLGRLRQQNLLDHIDPALLERLLKNDARRGELRIRQQAVAARLQFDLLPACRVLLDGEAVHGKGERMLLAPATLEIANVGRLHLHPGGEEAAQLARQQQLCDDALAADLQALALDSVEDAKVRYARYQRQGTEIEHQTSLLKLVAPQGLPALLDAQQTDQLQQQALGEQLAALPEAQAAWSLDDAQAQWERASAQLQTAEEANAQYRQARALAGHDVQNTAQEVQRLQGELQAPAYRQSLQQAQTRSMDLRADTEKRDRDIAALAQHIEAARADILQQDVERFDKTAAQLEEAARRRVLEIAELQARVQEQGAHGLEEQRAACAWRLDRAQRRCAELQTRAEALDLLLRLLREKRQSLVRRLQAPLQKHLNHYLHILFPQSQLMVDEQLHPTQLVRNSAVQTHRQEAADTQALSFGAREQVGLICRLAYADLLQQAGHPTLIMLDDALAHSDSQRLAQMKRILFDASQRHQTLLFTCHPQNWIDAGVQVRELSGFTKAS